MGTLRANINHKGKTVNGVLLGEPARNPENPNEYVWEHGKFPNGTITSNGTVIPETAE